MANTSDIASITIAARLSQSKIKKELSRNKYLYIMAIPVVLYYIVFHYSPLYGALIAFKNFEASKGIWGSSWVGLKHFQDFFGSIYFTRLMRNTILINLYNLIFGFPAPIILALLLNELRSKKYKSLVQTISYLPHFISIIVICGMITDFFSKTGIVTNLLRVFGVPQINLLSMPEYFRAIYVSTDIWQGMGWSSIIYLSALSGIDSELYEAASIDGAGRFKKFLNVTFPGLIPIITILFILRIGQSLSLGFEKIILLYNQNTWEVADVISSFVYRKGMLEGGSYSYTTAVGLFNSTINFCLLVGANYISRKVTSNSLW
ncbi:MAG: ABC transporter permease subunit [Eubacteriales bacterium]|nr:ABC transporter permease subunit [Eubacteriales bacterium]